MKRLNILVFGLCFLTALSLFIGIQSGHSADIEKISGMKFARLARGGILYDNWPNELGVKIDKTHPSYPAAGKKKGESTWRCKECHGWDYKGSAGAYSKGSHYSGIKGIRAYANQNPEDIAKIIRDDTHAFGKMIDDDAIESLSLFIAYGQIDMDLYIDRTTKKSIGDPSSGGRIYLSACTKCHGIDGKEINFKTEENPVFVGTAANDNPWETLHKIRWGHPGSQMISLLFLGLLEQLDVLAFCQTLP
jgi:thiosulfate dehydrogenase